MKRWEAVEAVAPKIEGELTVVCNGMLGRDLWNTGDCPERFYMIGSMGLIGVSMDVATVMMTMGDETTVTCEMSYASRLEQERFPETFIQAEGDKE